MVSSVFASEPELIPREVLFGWSYGGYAALMGATFTPDLFRCAVDEIKIPILIAQGANDPRVKQAESEQIVEAMKKKGIEYEYMLFPDEGHGFAKPENRLKFYAAAERFLARHLGGRCLGSKA